MSTISSTSQSPLRSSSTLSTDPELARNEILRSTLSKLAPSLDELASKVTEVLKLNKQLSTDQDTLWPCPPENSYYFPHHLSLTSRLSSSIKSVLNRSARSEAESLFRRRAEKLSETAAALQSTLSDIASTLSTSAQQYHKDDKLKTDMLRWRSDQAKYYGEENFASRLRLHEAVEASLSFVTAGLGTVLHNLGKVSRQCNRDRISVRDVAASTDEVMSDIEAVQRLLDACEAVVPLLKEESEIMTKLLSESSGTLADAAMAREPKIRPSRPCDIVCQ